MKETIKPILIAVVSAWGPSAHAASIQFDFGANGVYSGTVAPAHSTGDLGVMDTTWNGIIGSVTNGANTFTGLSYTDGNAAVGVSLTHWRQTNFATPANNQGTTTGNAFYSTTLVDDYIRSNGNPMGVRVTGLAAGTYNVYAITVNPGLLTEMFDVGIAVGAYNTGDLGGAVSLMTVDPSANSGAWNLNENYAFAQVTTTSTTDYITVLLGTNDRIVGLQVVQVPEPVSLLLSGFGGLMIIGRRRRSA